LCTAAAAIICSCVQHRRLLYAAPASTVITRSSSSSSHGGTWAVPRQAAALPRYGRFMQQHPAYTPKLDSFCNRPTEQLHGSVSATFGRRRHLQRTDCTHASQPTSCTDNKLQIPRDQRSLHLTFLHLPSRTRRPQRPISKHWPIQLSAMSLRDNATHPH